MFRPHDLQGTSFLIKSIARLTPPVSREFWNSFLAGVTKTSDGSNDPLAHLQLRNGNREKDAIRTHGMFRPEDFYQLNPDDPDGFRSVWGNREFRLNPNLVDLPFRPVVHGRSMYPFDRKRLHSKPQSTTLINVGRRIYPKVFAPRGSEPYIAGVLLPTADVLCNRLMRYDGGTWGRPYDRYDYDFQSDRVYSSLADMLGDPILKGPHARYSEILARLRWHNPVHPPGNPIKPAIFICASPDFNVMLHATFLALTRLMDLRFALLRKFNIRDNVPLVVYDPTSLNPATILTGYFELGDDENPLDFISSIISTCFVGRRVVEDDLSSPDLRRAFNELSFQIGLYQSLTNRPVLNPNFAVILREDPPRAWIDLQIPIFYLETLRALVGMMRNRPDFRPDLSEHHRQLLAPFLAAANDQARENLYITYGVMADFGHLPGFLEKINVRFLPGDHPFRRTILADAIRHNHEDKVFALIATMLSASLTPELINQQSDQGFTPLMMACRSNKADIASRLLLLPGIDVNILHPFRQDTALMFAIHSDMDIPIINQFLEKPGFNINYNHGGTALSRAFALGRYRIIMRLLDVPGIDLTAGLRRAASSFHDIPDVVIKKLLILCRNNSIAFGDEMSTLLSSSRPWSGEQFQEKRCHLCLPTDKPFGLLKIRHHCRGCGEAVCDKHSKKIKTLVNPLVSIRYCSACEGILQRPAAAAPVPALVAPPMPAPPVAPPQVPAVV